MSSRKHPAGRRARYSRRIHDLTSRPARFARSGTSIVVGDGLRNSQPFQGWLPTIELADGREAVMLEDLAERFYGRVEWPVIELADGSLAILLSDLRGGAVQ